MITLQKGIQSLSDRVADLSTADGTGTELHIAKTVILKDTSSDLQEYTAVSGATKEELNTTVMKSKGKIAINSQKIIGAAFTYNRIYYLNSNDEELIRLEITEVSESDINIDVLVELGDSSSVTIVNA